WSAPFEIGSAGSLSGTVRGRRKAKSTAADESVRATNASRAGALRFSLPGRRWPHAAARLPVAAAHGPDHSNRPRARYRQDTSGRLCVPGAGPRGDPRVASAEGDKSHAAKPTTTMWRILS